MVEPCPELFVCSSLQPDPLESLRTWVRSREEPLGAKSWPRSPRCQIRKVQSLEETNKWLYLRLAKMNTQQAGITGPVPSSGNGERLCILRRVLNVFLFFLQVYSQKLVSDGSATWCGVLEVISCEHLPFEMQSRTREPRGRSAPGADSNLCEVREELAWRRTSPATSVC